MKFRHILGLAIVLSCLAGLSAEPVRADQTDNGIQTLTDYFDFLVSGNLESAQLSWTDAAQERSARFGITYTGIPLRVDCTSPIVRDLEGMRMYLRPACRQAQALPDSCARMEYNNTIEGRQVKWSYYAQKKGGFYWLTYAQDCYSVGWPVRESRYFRIHVHPERKAYVNPAVMEEADHFVDRICDSLQIDKAARSEIASKKIEYFFCGDQELVNTITGQNTRGMLDLASNDIISSDFPHFHEIVHLLLNIKLKELPVTTLPILREGFAVRYGGRWGKRASALMDLGAYLYAQKLVDIDSILTTNGFNSAAGADIAYPLAGDFCSFLIQRIGLPKFYTLYLSLSRTDNSLDTLSLGSIENQFVAAVGLPDWKSTVDDFAKYLADALPQMAVAKPGKAEKGKELLNGPKFQVTRDQDWLNFEFVSDSANPAGSLLFGKDPRFGAGKSYLWDEQFGASYPFEGFRFGVRFDQNEAGLYDYATNELIAKYIFGISSTEGYFDPAAGKVFIRFRNSLLDKVVPSSDSYHYLPK